MTLFFYTFLYAGFIFLLQRILFSGTPKKILQCIPLYIICIVYILSIGCFLYDVLGLSNQDGFHFHTFLAWILIGINTTGLIADGIAWLIEKV